MSSQNVTSRRTASLRLDFDPEAARARILELTGQPAVHINASRPQVELSFPETPPQDKDRLEKAFRGWQASVVIEGGQTCVYMDPQDFWTGFCQEYHVIPLI